MKVTDMPLHFELVTPERLYRSADVHMVVVPGSEGDMGIMEGHAPIMSSLRNDAVLQIYASAGAAPEYLTISGGFAEVNAKGLTVLAEAVSAD
jgi:F-type H+-transporting ATPase subunit epsilon